MVTKLTFYGGVNEIGGNKILLEDSGTRVIIDFGVSFGATNDYFSEFMQPRKCNGLGDFLEFGLLPDLKGIYRSDFLKQMGRKKEDLECQGLLLSHAHADHASYINHLREDLPIYCSKETYHILKAMNDTASGSFTDLTDLDVCFETYINTKGGVSRKKDNKIERTFKTPSFGTKFRIDNLEIQPFNVDHSLCGATGYIIETSSGTIVYSGDFRFHGRRKEATSKFMRACNEAKPDVLIIEGTRVDENETLTEVDIEEEIHKIASQKNGISVCNWSVRDTDRMLSFLKVAKRLGKKLAISLKQARLLEELQICEDKYVPQLSDSDIVIYTPRKSWGLIGSECDKKLRNEDYKDWERKYLDNSINYKDVSANQSNYLFFCSNFDLKELIDIKPLKHSLYIKSVCEPFDEEMELEWGRMKNWLNHFGLSIYQTHVSGHASGKQLKEFVGTVEPKLIIPIHTENAQVYKKWGKTLFLEKNGDSLQL